VRARAGLAPRAKTGTGQTGAGTAKTTQNKKKTGFLRLEIDFLEISFFFFDFGPISPEKSAVFSCFGPSVRPSDGLRNEACGTLLGSLPHGPGGCCQPATRVARTGRCVGATSRCGPAHERRQWRPGQGKKIGFRKKCCLAPSAAAGIWENPDFGQNDGFSDFVFRFWTDFPEIGSFFLFWGGVWAITSQPGPAGIVLAPPAEGQAHAQGPRLGGV